MSDVRLGVLLWSQASDWRAVEAAARRVDELGYDSLWTWDHLYAIFGDPYQPIVEGWTSLAAWAMATDQTRLGLLVGANTFRNPGLTAKMAETLDHISDGRAILGVGGAWFELEHRAHGIDFGSGFGQRLDWLDEAVGAMRGVLDGRSATSEPGAHYAFDDLRHDPLPVQKRLPIMIGGSGEKKTLRTVAKYADMWNAMGSVEKMRHKIDVLREHCAEYFDLDCDSPYMLLVAPVRDELRMPMPEGTEAFDPHPMLPNRAFETDAMERRGPCRIGLRRPAGTARPAEVVAS